MVPMAKYEKLVYDSILDPGARPFKGRPVSGLDLLIRLRRGA